MTLKREGRSTSPKGGGSALHPRNMQDDDIVHPFGKPKDDV